MNTVVRALIDQKIKDEAVAVAVLASIGLTASDAFRMMMMRIAAEKRLPFEPLVPHAQTIEAMKAAQGRRSRCRTGCRRSVGRSECGRLAVPPLNKTPLIATSRRPQTEFLSRRRQTRRESARSAVAPEHDSVDKPT